MGTNDKGSGDSVAVMATRLEPFFRREVLRGRNKARLVAFVSGEGLDLLSLDVEASSNPAELAAMCESVIVMDCESADPAAYYRAEAEGGDHPPTSIVLRPKRKELAQTDPGELVYPKGGDARDSLIRQLMRHTEMATQRAIHASDAALRATSSALESMAKTNEGLRAQLTKDAEAAGAFYRNTTEAEARLLEAGGRADAFKELGRTLRYLAPRVVDSMSGADKFAPALKVIRRLTPEQLETAVAAGFLSAEDAEALAGLWHELRDEVADRKRLRSDGAEDAPPKNVVRIARKGDAQ